MFSALSTAILQFLQLLLQASGWVSYSVCSEEAEDTVFKRYSRLLPVACASTTASYLLRELERSYKIVHASSVPCGQLQHFLE